MRNISSNLVAYMATILTINYGKYLRRNLRLEPSLSMSVKPVSFGSRCRFACLTFNTTFRGNEFITTNFSDKKFRGELDMSGWFMYVTRYCFGMHVTLQPYFLLSRENHVIVLIGWNTVSPRYNDSLSSQRCCY